jgi:hypothetical protein
MPKGNTCVRNKIRGLAAIDIALLGYRLIYAEYLAGVVLALALGIFILFRSHSIGQYAFGAYLACLGINYVPMLIYMIAIGSRQNAQAEIADELADLGKLKKAMSMYRRVSLLLLVPLAAPILAFVCERSKANDISG